MKIRAIGFKITVQEHGLIRRMLNNVLKYPEAEIIDLECFTLDSVDKEDVLIIYGKKATKLLNGMMKKALHVSILPEPKDLFDIETNTSSREKAKNELVSLREKLADPKKLLKSLPQRITVTLSNGQKIIAGDSSGSDLPMADFSELLQLLNLPAFKEVSLDFFNQQDDSCTCSGGNFESGPPDDSDSD